MGGGMTFKRLLESPPASSGLSQHHLNRHQIGGAIEIPTIKTRGSCPLVLFDPTARSSPVDIPWTPLVTAIRYGHQNSRQLDLGGQYQGMPPTNTVGASSNTATAPTGCVCTVSAPTSNRSSNASCLTPSMIAPSLRMLGKALRHGPAADLGH